VPDAGFVSRLDAGAEAEDAGGLDAGPPLTSDDAGVAFDAGPLALVPVLAHHWGGYGTAPGFFVEPSSVEIGPQGVVIVAGHEDRVQTFTYEGVLLDIWGLAGPGDGEFNHPHGLAVNKLESLVYIGDQENHRVQVLTLDGTFVRQWGDAAFAHLHDVGVDRLTGDVFIGDYELDALRKFSSTGELLLEVGGTGTAPGEFDGVWGVSTDAARNVYVADTFNRRLQKLAVDGTFVAAWNDFSGTAFQKPTGVFVDINDVVYLCDSLAQRVYIFDTEGSPLDLWDIGAIYGQPVEPEDIVISEDGHDIFIGEVRNHRVLHLTR